MWSGPRNLSTAMMYAFGNRTDCAATDEPFYAAFLAKTGLDHPMRAEVLASQSNDETQVAQDMVGPVPGGRAIWYQKHMCHHMVDGMPLDWMGEVTNVFLIRHPARVIASYVAKRERPTAEDIGFVRQVALFDEVAARGPAPIVIESSDIRADPDRALRVLCAALGVPFNPAMLEWPAGPKPFDGIWAAHWYDAVHRSTGFAGAEGPLPKLEGEAADLMRASMPYYERMTEHRLQM